MSPFESSSDMLYASVGDFVLARKENRCSLRTVLLALYQALLRNLPMMSDPVQIRSESYLAIGTIIQRETGLLSVDGNCVQK